MKRSMLYIHLLRDWQRTVVRPHMMTSSNGNIFRVTGPLWGSPPVTVDSPRKGQRHGALMFHLFICLHVLSSHLANIIHRGVRFFGVGFHYNGCDGVSNHQPIDCLLKRLFRRRSKKTSKLRVTGFCTWSSPVTGEFPVQMASNTENVSIWWRHHVLGQRANWYFAASNGSHPITLKYCRGHDEFQNDI